MNFLTVLDKNRLVNLHRLRNLPCPARGHGNSLNRSNKRIGKSLASLVRWQVMICEAVLCAPETGKQQETLQKSFQEWGPRE